MRRAEIEDARSTTALKPLLSGRRRPSMTPAPLSRGLLLLLVLQPVSTSSLAAQPRAVTATVTRTFRLSSHTDSLLQQPSEIALSPDGRVLVSDILARNIKVYDSTGNLKQIIG